MTDKCVACGEVAEGKPLYKKLGSTDCQVEVFTALHEMELLSLPVEEKNNHYICWDCDETIAEEYITFITTEAKRKAADAKRKQQDEARKIKLQKKLRQAFKKAHDDAQKASGVVPPVSKYKMKEQLREENKYHATYCLLCKASFETSKARGYQRFTLHKMVDDECDIADVLQKLGLTVNIKPEQKRKRFVCCQCYNKMRRNYKSISRGEMDWNAPENALPTSSTIPQANDQSGEVFQRRPTTEEHAAEIAKLIPPSLANLYKVVTEEEGPKTPRVKHKSPKHSSKKRKKDGKSGRGRKRSYSSSSSSSDSSSASSSSNSSSSSSSSDSSSAESSSEAEVDPATPSPKKKVYNSKKKSGGKKGRPAGKSRKKGSKNRSPPKSNGNFVMPSYNNTSPKTSTIRTLLPKGANEYGSCDNDVATPVSVTSHNSEVVDFGICNLCGLGYNSRPLDFWYTLSHLMPSVTGVTVSNALKILDSDLAEVSPSVREKELVCKPCFSRVCKGFRSQILQRIAEKKGIDVNKLELSKIKVKMMGSLMEQTGTNTAEDEKKDGELKINGAINNNNTIDLEKDEKVIQSSSPHEVDSTSKPKIQNADIMKTVHVVEKSLVTTDTNLSGLDEKNNNLQSKTAKESRTVSSSKAKEEIGSSKKAGSVSPKKAEGTAATSKKVLEESTSGKKNVTEVNSSHKKEGKKFKSYSASDERQHSLSSNKRHNSSSHHKKTHRTRDESKSFKFEKCLKSFGKTFNLIKQDLELINLINESQHLRYKGKVVLLNSVTVDIANLKGILSKSAIVRRESFHLEQYKDLYQFTNFSRSLKHRNTWDQCIICHKPGLGLRKTTRWLEDPVAPPNLMVPLRWAQLSIGTSPPDSKVNLATEDGKVCGSCHRSLKEKFRKFVGSRVATSHGLSSEKVFLDKYKVSFDSIAMNIVADPLETSSLKEDKRKQNPDSPNREKEEKLSSNLISKESKKEKCNSERSTPTPKSSVRNGNIDELNQPEPQKASSEVSQPPLKNSKTDSVAEHTKQTEHSDENDRLIQPDDSNTVDNTEKLSKDGKHEKSETENTAHLTETETPPQETPEQANDPLSNSIYVEDNVSLDLALSDSSDSEGENNEEQLVEKEKKEVGNTPQESGKTEGSHQEFGDNSEDNSEDKSNRVTGSGMIVLTNLSPQKESTAKSSPINKTLSSDQHNTNTNQNDEKGASTTTSTEEKTESSGEGKQTSASSSQEEKENSPSSEEAENISSKEKEDTSISSKEEENTSISGEEKEDTLISSKEKGDASISSKEKGDSSISSKEKENNSISSEKKEDTSISSKEKGNTSVSSEEKKDTSISSKEKENTSVSSEEKGNTSVSSEEKKDTSISSKEKENASVSGEEKGNTAISKKEKKENSISSEEKENGSISKEKEAIAISSKEKENTCSTDKEKVDPLISSKEKENSCITSKGKVDSSISSKEIENPSISSNEKENTLITSKKKEDSSISGKEKENSSILGEEHQISEKESDEPNPTESDSESEQQSSLSEKLKSSSSSLPVRVSDSQSTLKSSMELPSRNPSDDSLVGKTLPPNDSWQETDTKLSSETLPPSTVSKPRPEKDVASPRPSLDDSSQGASPLNIDLDDSDNSLPERPPPLSHEKRKSPEQSMEDSSETQKIRLFEELEKENLPQKNADDAVNPLRTVRKSSSFEKDIPDSESSSSLEASALKKRKISDESSVNNNNNSVSNNSPIKGKCLKPSENSSETSCTAKVSTLALRSRPDLPRLQVARKSTSSPRKYTDFSSCSDDAAAPGRSVKWKNVPVKRKGAPKWCSAVPSSLSDFSEDRGDDDDDNNNLDEDSVAPFAQRKKFKGKSDALVAGNEQESMQCCLEDIWQVLQGISLDDLISKDFDHPLKLAQYNVGSLVALNDLRVHLGASLEDLLVWLKNLLPIEFREKGLEPSIDKFSTYLFSFNQSTELNSKLLKQVLSEELFFCTKSLGCGVSQSRRTTTKCFVEDLMADSFTTKESRRWEDFLAPVNMDNLMAGIPSRVSWNEFNNGLLYALWKVNKLIHEDEDNFTKWLALTSTTVMRHKDYAAMTKAAFAIDNHLKNYPDEISRLIAPIVIRPNNSNETEERAPLKGGFYSLVNKEIMNFGTKTSVPLPKGGGDDDDDDDIILEKEIITSHSKQSTPSTSKELLTKATDKPTYMSLLNTLKDSGPIKKIPRGRVLPHPPNDSTPPVDNASVTPQEIIELNGNIESSSAKTASPREGTPLNIHNVRLADVNKASAAPPAISSQCSVESYNKNLHNTAPRNEVRTFGVSDVANTVARHVQLDSNQQQQYQLNSLPIPMDASVQPSGPITSGSVTYPMVSIAGGSTVQNNSSPFPLNTVYRSNFPTVLNNTVPSSAGSAVPLIPIISSGGFMTMVPLAMRIANIPNPSLSTQYGKNSFPMQIGEEQRPLLESVDRHLVPVNKGGGSSDDQQLASKVNNLEKQLQEIQKQNSQLLEMNQKLLEKTLKDNVKEIQSEKEATKPPSDSDFPPATSVSSTSATKTDLNNSRGFHLMMKRPPRQVGGNALGAGTARRITREQGIKKTKPSFEDALNYSYKK